VATLLASNDIVLADLILGATVCVGKAERGRGGGELSEKLGVADKFRETTVARVCAAGTHVRKCTSQVERRPSSVPQRPRRPPSRWRLQTSWPASSSSPAVHPGSALSLVGSGAPSAEQPMNESADPGSECGRSSDKRRYSFILWKESLTGGTRGLEARIMLIVVRKKRAALLHM
jgi:hypothetical protein